jgi:hypothetical protein
MPFPARIGHHYDSVHVSGDRTHLGDVYHYEPSPEERAFNAVLESLKYPGMHDRRDALNEAHEGTFDWTFLEGETRFVEERIKFGDRQCDRFRTVNMDLKSWLENKDGDMYCVVVNRAQENPRSCKLLHRAQVSDKRLTSRKEVSCCEH